jgi:outer membrane protein insertion porin family
MKARLIAALVWALFCAPFSSAQSPDLSTEGIVRRIEFQGLQRISRATLRLHISSREGEPLDPARVTGDVRALERLGWFDNISVEVHPLPLELASNAPPESLSAQNPALHLIFFLEERPFLARVEFRGSRAMRREQITALLAAKGIALKLAAPANRTELWRARRVLQKELAELGYPQAEVRVRMVRVPTAAVRAIFEIRDGPRVAVARVDFTGNEAFSDRKLRGQMKHVAPGAIFAGARGKTTYTPARLGDDLDQLESFYRDRGYAEARLGTPEVKIVEQSVRRWFPWPRRQTRLACEISVPVAEGVHYRIERTEIAGAPPRIEPSFKLALRDVPPGVTYSETRILQARERIARRSAALLRTKDAPRPQVDVQPQFDREAATVRLTFRIRDDQPPVVRRIEFSGHHRFSDRYYRRRVLLNEGDPFDTEKLERGLAQLARSGFIRPVRPEDLQVRTDPMTQTVDISIRVEEIGRQRISLVGGSIGLGGTAGLVYNVFDLFGVEELITTHFEGGPGTLNTLVGIAKESLFGTRASLGLSLFHNVVRPRLYAGSGRDRLFTSRNSGFGLSSSLPVTPRDSLGLSYESSQNSTELRLPQAIPGVPLDSLRTGSARRAVGVSWSRESDMRDSRRERLDASASVSGGWLGGDEKLMRSSLEYARLHSDPLSRGRNAWAWRGYVGGVSTYDRGALPLQHRLYAGDQLVRGFRVGELAPYTVTTTQTSARVQAAGANLVAAVNGEYRVPLDGAASPRAEAAAFFDLGAGWLLPDWLGTSRTDLLGGTNGVLRASVGLELRFDLPVIRQPLRVHYAVNPLRLAREFFLPDGSPFRAPDRRCALSWALGSFF